MEERIDKINPGYKQIHSKIAPSVIEILDLLTTKELTISEAKYVLNQCLLWIDDVTLFN